MTELPPPASAETGPVPNVRLRTNVVCLRLFGPDHRTPVIDRWVSSPEVHDRLFFWDLLELGRRFYNLVPSWRTKEAGLTPRQLAERHAFLREGAHGGSLWQAKRGEYRPITTQRPVRPFFERPPLDPVGEPAPADEREEAEQPVPVVAEVTVPATAPPPPVPAAPDKRPVPVTPTPPVVTAPADAPAVPPPAIRRDDDQEGVVTAPVAARMLVLAPPGTGKTHTLIRRVRHLVETNQASGPHAVTVLSFTRAAVSEIVARITAAVSQGAADNLRYVTVRTFDSFASQMLRLDLPPEQMPGGYEGRIQRLQMGLHKHELPNAGGEVDRIRCLLIDEVQDLVGHRADLVLTLVRRVERNGGGIVLLGDFAQAIYDYQVEDEPRQRSSADFLKYIRNFFDDGTLSYHELRHNYRVASESMRSFVAQARSAMGEHGTMPDGQRIGELLQGLGTPATLGSMSAPAGTRRVAILARSNLQAFHFSEWCRARSLPCVTVQGATSSYCPGWIGRLSMGWYSRMMSRDDAGRRWEGLVGDRGGVSFDEAFARLERARVVVNGQIDMAALSRAVIEQRQELTAQDTAAGGLYVSTIHRSKGLEFDEVYLFDPSARRATWQGSPEEVRVVYVAATRAKSRLTLLRADAKALGMGGRTRKTPVKLHPHEYDPDTGRNRIFLDGLVELDTDSFLEDMPGCAGDSCKDRIAGRQQTLWEYFAGGGRTLDAIRLDQRLVFVAGGAGGTRVPVCRASAPLASDVVGLGYWFRQISVNGLLDTPMCSLATLAYPADDDEATEYLGPGRLLTAPVLRGWGTVG